MRYFKYVFIILCVSFCCHIFANDNKNMVRITMSLVTENDTTAMEPADQFVYDLFNVTDSIYLYNTVVTEGTIRNKAIMSMTMLEYGKEYCICIKEMGESNPIITCKHFMFLKRDHEVMTNMDGKQYYELTLGNILIPQTKSRRLASDPKKLPSGPRTTLLQIIDE